MVENLYRSKGVGSAFYSSGMARRVTDTVLTMPYLGEYPGGGLVTQSIFHHKQGVKARGVVYMIGDNMMTKLGNNPVARTTLSDLMFDMIARQGDPDVAPVVFGTPDFSLNFIKLDPKRASQVQK